MVASGDATRQALADRSHSAADGLGTRYHLLGPPWSDDVIDGLGYAPVGDIAEAEFLLGIGLDDGCNTVKAHEPILQAAAARDLPMICVNPDLVVIRIGVQEPCAGALAARYEELGGRVHYFGKPYPEVYDLALDGAQPSTVPRARGWRRPRHRYRGCCRRRFRFAADYRRPAGRRTRPCTGRGAERPRLGGGLPGGGSQAE